MEGLHDLTPVEHTNGRYYKRDDLLRYPSGVNGKVRVAQYLARKAKAAGAKGLVYGGSVLAPALGRVAEAARTNGLSCQLVIGSDPDKAVRHETVRVAVEAGAELVRSPVAYNTVLQKRAHDIADLSGGEIFQVPYGVGAPDTWSAEATAEFLDQDAPQVGNLPEGITDLVMPFGSGNAAAGVLYGLALGGGPESLERVRLIGVGPDRREWLARRMAKVDTPLEDFPVELEFDTTHPHFAEYKDRMPETEDGINFHPTYEGKVVRYLNFLGPEWWTARDGKVCFWVVGGPL